MKLKIVTCRSPSKTKSSCYCEAAYALQHKRNDESPNELHPKVSALLAEYRQQHREDPDRW